MMPSFDDTPRPYRPCSDESKFGYIAFLCVKVLFCYYGINAVYGHIQDLLVFFRERVVLAVLFVAVVVTSKVETGCKADFASLQ